MRIQKIILILAIVLSVGVILVYNGIIIKQEMIGAKWAQVDDQLQRRNDLISVLVNTVKGYSFYEKNILENITNARSQWAKAINIDEKVLAAGQMDTALSKLILVVENYTDLKDNEKILVLMDEFSGAENRIDLERMRYNEAVKNYNIAVRTFPGDIISNIFGFKPSTEYFKADPSLAGNAKR
ncbi:MAG: LemA family protein [Candidatus Omnitrophota bacterium]